MPLSYPMSPLPWALVTPDGSAAKSPNYFQFGVRSYTWREEEAQVEIYK